MRVRVGSAKAVHDVIPQAHIRDPTIGEDRRIVAKSTGIVQRCFNIGTRRGEHVLRGVAAADVPTDRPIIARRKEQGRLEAVMLKTIERTAITGTVHDRIIADLGNLLDKDLGGVHHELYAAIVPEIEALCGDRRVPAFYVQVQVHRVHVAAIALVSDARTREMIGPQRSGPKDRNEADQKRRGEAENSVFGACGQVVVGWI